MHLLKYCAIFLLLLGMSIFYTACTKGAVDEELPFACPIIVTYENQIKLIINTSCASSNCHDGSRAIGDYRSYEDMQGILNDEGFKKQVVDKQTMPPETVSANKKISADQFELLKCWVEQGYPKN